MNATIGTTIFEQLGGNRFSFMVGMRSVTTTERGLRFTIGRNMTSANLVEVTLGADDTYTLQLFRVRSRVWTLVDSAVGVMVADLRRVFEERTGLYTSL